VALHGIEAATAFACAMPGTQSEFRNDGVQKLE
jgi:hypothetical protein